MKKLTELVILFALLSAFSYANTHSFSQAATNQQATTLSASNTVSIYNRKVTELYASLFGRAPDAEGLHYWTNELSSGKSLVAIAQAMYDVEPSRAYYPLSLSRQQIIENFYTNVLGRNPDTEGLTYWLSRLEAGNSKGQVIVDIINAVVAYGGNDTNALISQTLFNNKIEVGLYYAATLGGSDVVTAKSLFNGITSEPTTVIAAKDIADNSVGVPTQPASDIAPPTAPSLLAGLATSPTQLSLSWAASEDNVGVSKYLVFRNGAEAAIGIALNTNYNDTTVEANTNYSYTVKAVDAAGNISPASNTITVSTPFNGASEKARQIAAALGRGINFGNMLEAPHEGDWGGLTVTDDFIAKAHSAGFKSIRLPVRWSNHADSNSPYAIDVNFMTRVENVVDKLLSTGFYVVLDMHHYRQFDGDPLDAGEREVSPQVIDERFVKLWEQIGDRFKNKSDHLLFELYNEPHNRLNGEPWNVLSNQALIKVRLSNPNRVVVIGPTSFNTADSLKLLTLPNDPHLLVTIHNYDPGSFTHQGAEWVTPITPTGITCCTTQQHQQMIAQLDKAKAWTELHGYPLYLGEFGAYNKADLNSRINFNRYMRDQAELRSISWAYWEFAAGFGVYDPVKLEFRSPLLDSLMSDQPIVLDTSAPSAPANLVAAAVTASKVNLSWTASSDNVAVTKYFIFRDGAATSIGSATTNTFSDSTVAANTAYSYTVKASDAAGNLSTLSNTAAVTTPPIPDTIQPTTPTRLVATATAANKVDLAWSASSDNVAVANYLIFRNGAATSIGNTSTTNYSDTTVAASTQYSYTIRASDVAGNLSAVSSTVTVTTPAINSNIRNVSNATELQDALSRVNPGETINLSPGIYSGTFTANRSGAMGKPITLTGPSSAILKNATGYGFNLQADYWVLHGITVSDSSKGIVLDGANNNVLEYLTVKNIGDEGIHLRAITLNGATKFSSNNVIQYSEITDTGKAAGRAGYGEAIYLGSATEHWPDRSNNKPDTSNNNCVYQNKIGPNVSAEGIDIKEGTTAGLIIGNTYYAAGISGENAADSFIDAKGNNYLIYGNLVDNSATKTTVLVDAFQTHQKYTGFGNRNIFQKNTVDLSSTGYGININSTTSGNQVCNDNLIQNAGSGITNIGTTQCTAIPMPSCADVINAPVIVPAVALFPSDILDLSHWKIALPISLDGDIVADEIKPSAIVGKDSRPWFQVNESNDGVLFRVYLGGARTSTSTKYTRSELREMASGDTSAAWPCLTASRGMQIEQAVLQTSTHKPEVAIGQIHDASNDNLMIKYVGPTNANGITDTGGKIEVHFNNNTSNQTKILDSAYNLGDRMAVDISTANGTMTVTYKNLRSDVSTSTSQAFTPAMISGSCYFKAGTYVQDCVVHGDYGTNAQCNVGTPDDDKDKFAEVEIRKLLLK